MNPIENNKGFRVAVLVLAAGLFATFLLNSQSSTSANSAFPINSEAVIPPSEPMQNYSRFRHSVTEHSSLPCLLCHKRSDNSPTMKFSGHLPCAGCHVQQFADNKSPICSICHTETGLKRFPPLRSFGVQFSHSVHSRQANCATCHKPSRTGIAFSIPSGRNGHATCFQCHKPDTQIGGRNIGACNICHQPGRPPNNTDWAKAFTVNFKHSEHSANRKLNCASCHTVGRNIVSPVAAMHLPPRGVKSCSTCHDNSRAFGGNDFADCKRCHENGTFRFR
jgi:c(7)-type cytochrome triheme protein